MDPFFGWLEATTLSRWLRESLSVFAFPTILTLHTVGLACLAGPSAAIDLRLLGVAPELPIRPLERFFPVMWIGFWLNAVTGLALVVAYPTKALTNPLFYVKLLLIALALGVLQTLRRRVFRSPELCDAKASRGIQWLAAASLALWLATIFSGRWLAYTYQRLLVDL